MCSLFYALMVQLGGNKHILSFFMCGNIDLLCSDVVIRNCTKSKPVS